jgi:hypothetical protein
MKYSHKTIKEKLPEYIREESVPEEVHAHLKECSECRQDAEILRGLLDLPVPEPGGMFFETLPQKTRALLKDDRKSPLFRLVPAFVLFALIVITGFVYYAINKPEVAEELYAFNDPLATRVFDLGDLNENDIPSAIEITNVEELYMPEETSFLREFAYLNAEEMEALYEALNTQ